MSEFDEMEKSFLAEIGTISPYALPACPPLDMLLAHGQGVLPEEAEQKISSHLAQCSLCRILREDFPVLPGLEWSSGTRERIRENLPPPVRRPSQGLWYGAGAVAASFAIAAVLMHAMHAVHRPQAPRPASPSQRDTIARLEIDKLPLPSPAAPVLVFRGATPSEEPDAAELKPAFAAYEQSQYQLAALRFGELAKQYPRDDLPVLYLGVSQLLEGDDTAALQSLARADRLAKPATKDAASWYHAAAAVRIHSAEAGPLLQSLCRRDTSVYAGKACALSGQFDTNAR